jgi:hypothetical protein
LFADYDESSGDEFMHDEESEVIGMALLRGKSSSDDDEAPQLVQLSKKQRKKEEEVFAAAEDYEEIIGESWSKQQLRQSLPYKEVKVSEESINDVKANGGKISRGSKKKRRRTT